MVDVSPKLKKLLEIRESDTTPLKPIECYQELLKEENYINDDKAVAPARVFGSEFKNDAQDYLSAPSYDQKDSYVHQEETMPVVEKNTANLASIVAVAQSSSTKTRPRAKPRVKPKPKSKQSNKTKNKKSLAATKKLTTFKILRKNK